jgi:SagB-type dehydrogenase family enzyme
MLGAMKNEIFLPQPQLKGKISVEQAISQRRSKRNFSTEGLTLEQISQLLWSAQGITGEQGKFRTAPSAGAVYPIQIYLLNKDGLFHYLSKGHKLSRITTDYLCQELAKAALGQSTIAQAPVDIVITAVYEDINLRYGSRAKRYTDIEVGHIAQNIHLQSVALGLGSVPIGAFDDLAVKRLLKLPDEEQPLYIIPIGYPT